MTIEEAISKYAEACANNAKPPFSEIITTLIEQGYDKEFSNDSFFDALCLTHTMLDRTFVSAKVLTGGDGTCFWKAICKPLESAATRLENLGGKVQFIVLDATGECKEFFRQFRERYPAVFDYKLAKAGGAIRHFIVCDSRMLRIEEPHGSVCGQNVDATIIKAQVNFSTPSTATLRESFFDGLWKRLTPSAN